MGERISLIWFVKKTPQTVAKTSRQTARNELFKILRKEEKAYEDSIGLFWM